MAEWVPNISQGVSQKSTDDGDVVLVHDELTRNKWPLSVIEEIITGGDGLNDQHEFGPRETLLRGLLRSYTH